MIELTTLVEYFEDAEEATRDARLKSEQCRDYYDNKQLTAEVITTLNNRNQPPVVNNLIQPKVDFMLGAELEARTDPKAFPRTPLHDEGANAATDAIRFVLDNNVFDPKASDVFENMLVEGTGGVAVEAKVKGNKIEIDIPRFRWDRFFIDQHSMERDGSDAKYMGVISWKDLDDALQRWPNAEEMLVSHMAQASETFDDKPQLWYNKKRQRVMCVDMAFIHEGKWHQAIFAKGAWLEEPKISVYVDEDFVPQNKFLPMSAKVKRNGERYGFVEGLLDRQDVVNKTHSKVMHILNTRQTFSKGGMLDDRIDAFKKEIHKPDGHLSFPATGEFGKDFGFIDTQKFLAPQFDLYVDAKQSFDTGGVNAALSGTTEKGLSGRAVGRLQKGGMLELGPFFGAHAQWKIRVYRAVWDRIRQFWREDKWLRVTDDEENLKFVGLNMPFSLAEQRIMEATGLKLSEVRQQFGNEIQRIHAVQPQLAQIVALENDVIEMDVDITLEEVPDVPNMQAEEFEILAKLFQAAPDKVDFRDIIAMSTLRNKRKYLGKEQTPEEQQAQQRQQQIEELLMGLETADKQAGTAVKQSTALLNLKKADQTDIESKLLLTSPPPDKVAII